MQKSWADMVEEELAEPPPAWRRAPTPGKAPPPVKPPPVKPKPPPPSRGPLPRGERW